MNSIPSTAEFDQLCRELVDELNRLRAHYRLAHDVAFSRQVVESVPVRGSKVSRLDQETLLAEAEAVTKDHGKLRRSLRDAAASVRVALHGVKTRHNTWRHYGLEQSLDGIKQALLGDEKRHGGAFDPKLFPPNVTRADLADSLERQRERGVSEVEPILETDYEARMVSGEPDIWTAFKHPNELPASERRDPRR